MENDFNREMPGQTHADLQKLILQKEGALKAKSRLIDNMAYQIRTLSNAIIGFSDLLLIEDLPGELMEYVREIHQAGNGLSALVNEVLDWARLESGRLQIVLRPCATADLVHETERILSAAASERGLACAFSHEQPCGQILSDADQLLKCLINLAGSAIGQTAEGKITFRVGTQRRQDQVYAEFEFACDNTLSAEQIEKLFEPAHEDEAHSAMLTMLDRGLTLTAGLPLTKQLAEALGGAIEVDSEPAKGTRFRLVLPTGYAAEETPPLTEPAQAAACANPAAGALVLLVEDQPSNRTVIGLMLESLGVQADTAEDGCQGVEKALEKPYNLILMDLKMPKMDGYEAAKILRQKNIGVPIIALSAKVLNGQESTQIHELFDGFVCKPVDSRKLAETLARFLPSLQHFRAPQQADEKAGMVIEYKT